jgi:hypothetical protein
MTSFCESPDGGQLTAGLKNERIPFARPMPIQTFFGDGSVIINIQQLFMKPRKLVTRSTD